MSRILRFMLDRMSAKQTMFSAMASRQAMILWWGFLMIKQVAWQVAWQVLSGVFHQFLSILFCFHVNRCSAKVRRAILWEMFGYFKAAQPAARWGETVLTLPHPGMNGHSVPPGPTTKKQPGQREKVPVWVFDHKAPPPKPCTDSDHEPPWNLKLIRILSSPGWDNTFWDGWTTLHPSNLGVKSRSEKRARGF